MGLISRVMTLVMRVTGVMRPGLPWVLVVSLMSSSVTSHWNPLIAACPGEGPRYGDYKCIHDRTHRVCASGTSQARPGGTGRGVCVRDPTLGTAGASACGQRPTW